MFGVDAGRSKANTGSLKMGSVSASVPMTKRNLDERVAVVTGAASGIGRAIAQNLADKGCHLALVDVD